MIPPLELLALTDPSTPAHHSSKFTSVNPLVHWIFLQLDALRDDSVHWWILEEKTDIALGLYFVSPDGRGGHPLMVCPSTKDHLCSIVPLPIRWQGSDTTQMILGILGHRQRVSPSPAPVAGI